MREVNAKRKANIQSLGGYKPNQSHSLFGAILFIGTDVRIASPHQLLHIAAKNGAKTIPEILICA